MFHAGKGDIRQVRRMLAQGVNINVQNYDFRTALHLAVAEGFMDRKHFHSLLLLEEPTEKNNFVMFGDS